MADTDWQALANPTALAAWMAAQGLGHGTLQNPRALTGGTQNLLLRFDFAGQAYVLRRPPPHPRGDGNATIAREARVLAALRDTDVPHPRLLGFCPDPTVIGAAFTLMQAVDGFNPTTGLPALHAADPAIRHQMGFCLIDALLALGRVDYVAKNLADFGNPAGFLTRQAPRWLAMLDGYADFAGWPGQGGLPGIRDIAAWIAANAPADFTPGIMHGDFHLANVMFATAGPQIAAIVDWELCTIGDPLLDLGWIIATWPDENGYTAAGLRVDPWDNFAPIAELIAYYKANSPRDVSAIGWYGVLACFKLAVILEGTFARAHAGRAPMAVGQFLHTASVALLGRATKMIDRSI